MYHWCKECKYRPQAKARTVKKGKTELIEFFCILDNGKEHGTLYYKGDFDRYKESCPSWEPYQLSIGAEP